MGRYEEICYVAPVHPEFAGTTLARRIELQFSWHGRSMASELGQIYVYYLDTLTTLKLVMTSLEPLKKFMEIR